MIVKDLGLCGYPDILTAMQKFTLHRSAHTEDELWLLEHHPVFTQGINGQAIHILEPGDIPVVQTDRGGQVTYHGPGQLIAYTLFDLKRLNRSVRDMVSILEDSVICLLEQYDIAAYARADAPGVYVDGKKVASLGLKVKKGYCYHGVSLNVAMDLQPFSRINPCGYPGMEMIDLQALGLHVTMKDVKTQFVAALRQYIDI